MIPFRETNSVSLLQLLISISISISVFVASKTNKDMVQTWDQFLKDQKVK